jgi:hypothetical protein
MQGGEEIDEGLRDLDGVGSESIDRSRKLQEFMRRVFGSAASHSEGTFNDWTAAFRYGILLKLADKVNEIHRQRRIEDRTIPISPRLAIPLLQKATLEEDDILQDMWAAFIANAMDPQFQVGSRRTLVDLLASLEPVDAMVLRAISRDAESNPRRHALFYDAALAGGADKPHAFVEARNMRWIARTSGLSLEEAALSVESLARLGLIIDHMPVRALSAIPVPATHPGATLELTHTGRLLIGMCSHRPTAGRFEESLEAAL